MEGLRKERSLLLGGGKAWGGPVLPGKWASRLSSLRPQKNLTSVAWRQDRHFGTGQSADVAESRGGRERGGGQPAPPLTLDLPGQEKEKKSSWKRKDLMTAWAGGRASSRKEKYLGKKKNKTLPHSEKGTPQQGGGMFYWP